MGDDIGTLPYGGPQVVLKSLPTAELGDYTHMWQVLCKGEPSPGTAEGIAGAVSLEALLMASVPRDRATVCNAVTLSSLWRHGLYTSIPPGSSSALSMAPLNRHMQPSQL